MLHSIHSALVAPLAAIAITVAAYRTINTYYLIAFLLVAILGQLLAIRETQKG